MVGFATSVQFLFPLAVPLRDYVVEDNGDGPVITHWNESLGPQPTPAQLAAVTQAQVDEQIANKKPELKTLRQQAAQAIADIDTFLAIATPTNPQTLAFVKQLGQQNKRIIQRLVQID